MDEDETRCKILQDCLAQAADACCEIVAENKRLKKRVATLETAAHKLFYNLLWADGSYNCATVSRENLRYLQLLVPCRLDEKE